MRAISSVRSFTNDGVKANYLLHFPKQYNVYDVDWLALISKRRRTMLSRLLVDSDSKLSVPKAEVIDRLEGRNGLSSSSVVILDAKTVMISDFTFKALAPNTYFWAGTGFEPDEYGEPVLVDGRTEALGKKINQTLILELPKGKTIHDIDYIGLYSKTLKLSLAHVKIPPELIVPPSPEDLGIRAEAELNCERLSDPRSPVNLELRWSITTDDNDEEVIIMQLVSTSGSDRYIALGIRLNDDEKSLEKSKIAGDVIVGWINSKSGKGGVGDYFLAKENNGEFACSDGAESCPDHTFKSGGENVALLNAVHRENYTMLTVQRPLRAKDEFDVNINLDEPQNVFWSIGYKSPFMRRNNPPLKNKAPIRVDFGRRPVWNCPKAEERIKPNNAADEIFINEPSNENQVIDRAFQSVPNNIKSWNVPAIECGDSTRGGLYVQLGGATPVKGNRDLKVAMYVNGLAAPDIYLPRGQEATFVVETGSGTNPLGLSHPFYITTDPEGGFGSKGDFDRSSETVFAGVNEDDEGNFVPVGLGRLCLWRSPRPADAFGSYKEYHMSGLRLECPGESDPKKNRAGVYKFTPKENMPDVLYYHSYFAKNVGGRLFLTNFCEKRAFSDEVLTTFRPKLNEGTDAELKRIKEKNDKERQLSRLQALLKAREERTRPKRRKQNKTTGSTKKYTREGGKKRRRCLRKRTGQLRYRRSPFTFDADMPTFEHFPQREGLPRSSSEIHYNNNNNENENDYDEAELDGIDEGTITDFDRIGSVEEFEEEENCLYDDEIDEDTRADYGGDSMYNMAPHEDVASTVEPPPWTNFWGPTAAEPTRSSPPAINPQPPPIKEPNQFTSHARDVFKGQGAPPSAAITVTSRPSISFSSGREPLPEGETFIDSPSSFRDIEKIINNNNNPSWNDQDYITAPTVSTTKFYFTTTSTKPPSFPLSHQSDPNKLNNGYLFSPKPRIKKHQSNNDDNDYHRPQWVKHQPLSTTQRPFTVSVHPAATHFKAHNNNGRPKQRVQPARPPPPPSKSFPLFNMKNPFAQLMSPFSSVLEPTNKWLFGRGEPKKPQQQQHGHRVITTPQPPQRLLPSSPTAKPRPPAAQPPSVIPSARPHFPPNKAPSNPIPKRRPLKPNPRRGTKLRKPQGLPSLFRLPLLPPPKRPLFLRRPQQQPPLNVRRFLINQQQQQQQVQQPSQRRASSVTPQYHPALATTARPVHRAYDGGQVKRAGIQIREKGLEGVVANQGFIQQGGEKAASTRRRKKKKKRRKRKKNKAHISPSPVFASTTTPKPIKRPKLSPAPSNVGGGGKKSVFPGDETRQRPHNHHQQHQHRRLQQQQQQQQQQPHKTFPASPERKNFQVIRHNRGEKNFFHDHFTCNAV